MQEEQMIGTTLQTHRAKLLVMTPQGDLLSWGPMDGDAPVGPTVVQHAEVDGELVTELRTLAGLLADMYPRARVIGGNLHGPDSDNNGSICN
jgi:hypothetical protein